MQRMIYAALSALLVLLAVAPAEASRHSRHRHHLHQIDRAQIVVRHHRHVHRHRTAKRHHIAPTDANGSPAFTTDLIAKARVYSGLSASQIGLHRRSLWCAAFLRFLGVSGPVDDRAISFSHLRHVSPQVGAIAVYPHHVGIVTGFSGGYPIIISGNSYGRRVYEGRYPRTPIAYVTPG
jgi:hypothetical protein